MNTIHEFIKKLPKCELHLHIEGSLEPDLMLKLAKRNDVELKYKSIEEIQQAYQFDNLQSFLDIYYEGAGVLQKEEDFYELTMAYLERAVADNVKHTEIFFDPQTHTDRGIPFDVVVSGIHKALQDGKEMGISSKLIMCFLRHLSEDAAFETLNQALTHKDKICAVGLDSSEVGHPPSKFERVFTKALEEGFLTVAHAGEEGDPSYIWEALDLLKVSRIDHGVRCLEDEVLVARLKQEQVHLTVCPLSNIKLRVFDQMKDHKLKRLWDAGLSAGINSDDPAYFGGYMNQNFLATQEGLALSKEDLRKTSLDAFNASFLSESEKRFWCDKVVSFE
ncbi:MAG: adenosine deaminase [Lentisphaeraceae bacterium]|nr:adenosine deaminase [Lentisphaeraceae bacterium]